MDRRAQYFLQESQSYDSGTVAGYSVDGSVQYSARLLQSTISHSAGHFRITASPRGSLSSLAVVPLPTTTPEPNQVPFHIEKSFILAVSAACITCLLCASDIVFYKNKNCPYVIRWQLPGKCWEAIVSDAV
jgi:hypothetical protein